MADFVRLGYDLRDDSNDWDDDDVDGFGTGYKLHSISKNATVFIIDVSSPDIFKPFSTTCGTDDWDNDLALDENVCNKTLFEIALTCVTNFIKSKIICSDKDFIACVLIGTEKGNDSEFKNIYTILPLELPGAKSVIEVEKIKNNFADSKLGTASQISYADAFWFTQSLFARVTSALAVKQVFMFTTKEDPHQTNMKLRRATQQRVLDLANNGIEVDVLGLAAPDGCFDLSLFWESALPSLKGCVNLPDPTVKIKELLQRVSTKEYSSRALSSTNLDLFGKKFAVKIFSFVNVAKKPSWAKLDQETNKEVRTKTEMVSAESGQVLMPDEISFAQTYGGTTITLSKMERDSLKYLADSGISILGFRSVDSLKFENYVRPAHFIYPDESSIAGSLVLFQSLLASCLKKNVCAICQVISKSGAFPKLAALKPQEELFEEETGVQLKPPGFNVIYLPYVEDVRDLSSLIERERPRANMKQVETASNMINKLKIGFDPENFRNPYLARFYSYIEALAFETEDIEEPVDSTNPTAQEIDERLGKTKDEFEKLFFPNGKPVAAAKRKAGVVSSSACGAPAKKRADASAESVDAAEMRKAATEKKLGKFTVPVLKLTCELYQLSTLGRKQELIDRLDEFFKTN